MKGRKFLAFAVMVLTITAFVNLINAFYPPFQYFYCSQKYGPNCNYSIIGTVFN